MIRQTRDEQIKKDVALSEEAIEGALLGDPSDEEIAGWYASVRARRKQKK